MPQAPTLERLRLRLRLAASGSAFAFAFVSTSALANAAPRAVTVDEERPAGPAAAGVSSGAALFAGARPLAAHLRGHPNLLPPAAVRCINCHASGAAGATYGPVLNRDSLTLARPRRGGPDSAFDLAGFCRLLRTGIDPAAILLPSAMPVYRVSDRQCAALWSYLVQPPRSP